MTLINPEEVFKNGVSPSMVKLWLLCKRKWYNHYIRGIKKNDGTNIAAVFGTAMHKCLANWYDPNKDYRVDNAVREFDILFPDSLDTNKRTNEIGTRLLRLYAKRYPKETEPFKVITTEEEIKVKVNELDVPLHFIIDMLVERNIGGFEVWDHKTTGRLGASYFDKFVNDYQVYVYLYGMSKHLNKRIEGLTINAIGCKKVVNNDSLLRNTIEKDPKQIEYHMKHFFRISREMIEFARKNWQDPEMFALSSDGFACTAYITKCQFLEICEFNDNKTFLEELSNKYKGD